MGDSQRPPEALGPEKLESFRNKLIEFEALGLDTSRLRRILEERPQDFEEAAEAFLRTEILGEAQPDAPPEAPAAAAPAAHEETATPAPEPTAPVEEPVAVNFPETVAPDVPPSEPINDPSLEPQPVVDSYVEPEPTTDAAPPVDEVPAGSEAPPAAPDLLEMELEAAVAEEEAAAMPAPPPLAGGDSLEVGYAVPTKQEPSTAGTDASAAPAHKPPPPSARRAAAEGTAAKSVRVKAAAQAGAIPPGAKPAAAAEGGAVSEAFPEERKSGRGKWAAAAVALIVVGGIVPYMFFGNAAPVAAFSVSAGPHMAGASVFFSANETVDKEGQIVSYRWEFGDGLNDTGKVVEHAYTQSGNYTVRLTVADVKGATGQASNVVSVQPGQITVPLYTLGDSLSSTASGRSSVRAPGGSLGSFTADIPPFGTSTIQLLGVNATYTGTQTRSVASGTSSALDGFIKAHPSFANQRELNMQVHAEVDNTGGVSPLIFNGPARITQRDFQTLASNDTVRTHTLENVTLTTDQTRPSTTLSTEATLIEYPDLSKVEDQLHLEEIYAGRTFSTEGVSSDSFDAVGESWSWITQGTEIIGGHLTIKINVTLTTPEPAQVVFMVVWVASNSPFPLREHYFARGFASGKSYETEFHSQVTGAAVRGTTQVPFENTNTTYFAPPPASFSALGKVPRGGLGPDFAFPATEAYNEVYNASPDFQNFVNANPQAYAVNGTYGLNVGNPRWILDFASNPIGERIRIVDEHTPTPFTSTGTGQTGAQRSTTQIGNVVSLDFAAGAIEQEEQGRNLFPAGSFDAARANFTVRIELAAPSLNFNAASTGGRQSVAYAFGAESIDSQQVRYTVYVDATTGQLMFSLAESGDTLP